MVVVFARAAKSLTNEINVARQQGRLGEFRPVGVFLRLDEIEVNIVGGDTFGDEVAPRGDAFLGSQTLRADAARRLQRVVGFDEGLGFLGPLGDEGIHRLAVIFHLFGAVVLRHFGGSDSPRPWQ